MHSQLILIGGDTYATLLKQSVDQIEGHSNVCRIFSVEDGPINVWGPDFRGSEQNFTIGQSPKIYCNFKKYALKLLKS